MHTHIQTMLALLRQRWHAAHEDDQGASAIEWAIFAILALLIAGLVAAAIEAAVRNRLPGIK